MLRIDIIAPGRLKSGPLHDLWHEYMRRIMWPVVLHEIESKNNADELGKIESKIKPGHTLVILDERGKSIASRDFSQKLAAWSQSSGPDIQFVLGGADGLSDTIRKRASFVMAFGAQTWPHMLARVMLAEQLYRAQQILSGHPYHRD